MPERKSQYLNGAAATDVVVSAALVYYPRIGASEILRLR
jgi:hypothetical protein